MTTVPSIPSENSWQRGIKRLTTGAKLMMVGLLALIMSLTTLWIDSLNDERANQRQATVNQISEHAGGHQTLLGPTLFVPYSYSGNMTGHGTYVIFPVAASAAIDVKAENVKRALASVPVYEAQATMQASFDLAVDQDQLPAGAVMDWTHSELMVGMSDARGSLGEATVATAKGPVAMTPAVMMPRLTYGDGDHKQSLTLMSTHPQATAGDKFIASVSMHFSGAQQIAMLPYGRSTRLEMRGNYSAASQPFRSSQS